MRVGGLLNADRLPRKRHDQLIRLAAEDFRLAAERHHVEAGGTSKDDLRAGHFNKPTRLIQSAW
jgi:hypothetical protein